MAWRLAASDLKRYPHFDSPVSISEAEELALSPERVARHSFFPFLLYTQRWNRWAPKGEKGKPKERPIRYAARKDAYILSRYRHLLSERYEALLHEMDLQDCVLAYRRLKDPDEGSGKCNIHFARDAIDKVRDLGDCTVVALDISGYFESLDHSKIKDLWCRLLGTNRLPADHFSVFRAVTSYAVVDKMQVYERLGIVGEKGKTKSGKPIKGYLVPFKEVPKRICSGIEFRTKIAGNGGRPSIIRVNKKSHGIPQGAPISDLLANLYLIDFDFKVNQWAKQLGGLYLRYSDDILVILPGDGAVGLEMMTRIRELISDFGSQLVIKAEKSAVFEYQRIADRQVFRRVHGTGGQGKNGFEYLGFRYDGQKVFLRDATLSNLWRKVTRSAQRSAIAAAKRYPDKDVEGIKSLFNYDEFIKNFGRAEDFGEKHSDIKKWTFWTYARRASAVLGLPGLAIHHQLARHRRIMRAKIDRAIERAVQRRASAGPA